ncbi:hypothetical protein RSOLAG1IB_12493 [Rhizoctonia solani AG-1 IB]|uniref:Uncharacterized protein n=1 Tax=Thanatephorus cucumeris (strain AG1-IB / isolate 7/3/14) TaxID=1108050 RepID=A0A0B7G0T1_THACB|nr:hypothetical protein RSOLAG1IB_12493 [Rhizoctonia solani AG-1 IB]
MGVVPAPMAPGSCLGFSLVVHSYRDVLAVPRPLQCSIEGIISCRPKGIDKRYHCQENVPPSCGYYRVHNDPLWFLVWLSKLPKRRGAG